MKTFLSNSLTSIILKCLFFIILLLIMLDEKLNATILTLEWHNKK